MSLICVGRAKAGAERDLAERYIERARAAGRGAGLAIVVNELDEARARRPDARKTEEAAAIGRLIGPDTSLIALDERGAPLDSAAFAALIGKQRDAGVSALALVIGGPDGLASELRERAVHTIAFGAMTWPHQLVRVMASEQLYRAVTILTGHPYHRV